MSEKEKSQVQLAAEWAAEEYERRTLELGRGLNKIAWAHPSYRVDWHEICAKFNMKVVGPLDRVEFQPLFRKEMAKRKLTKVLNGKEHIDEWMERTGKK